jgi:RimJ/RimL family protein N-acetyltransferase
MNSSPERIHMQTERLVLYRPSPADIAAIYAIHADPVLNRFSLRGPMRDETQAVDTLTHWHAEWEDQGWGHWSIATRAEPDRIIGFGGLSTRPRFGGAELVESLRQQHAANLYFRFSQDSWGKGYANEMAQQALQLAFGAANLRRVIGITSESNTSSRRALERLRLRYVEPYIYPDVPGHEPNLLYAIDAENFTPR